MNKVWGGLALAAGTAFAIFIYQDGAEHRAVMKNGIEATVEPVTQYREVRRKGEGTGYSVELKFKTDKGAPATVNRTVSRNIIDQFQSGQPVKVRYLAGDVSSAKVVGHEGSWFKTILMWGVTIFLIGFGLFMFAPSHKKEAS